MVDAPGPLSDLEIVRSVADDLPVGVWVARAPSGEFVYANRRFQDIMGMGARDDVAAGEYAAPYGIHDREGNFYPERRMPFVRALETGGTVEVDDIVIHRTDGGRVFIRAFARAIGEPGPISHVVIAFIDITREVEAERARAESDRRLLLGQRMEAIGTLAAGIAHDVNNLLAGLVLVASDLAATERDPTRRETIATIDLIAERAAALTRSLLGFARRGQHRAVPVGLHPLIVGLTEMFQRTLGPAVTFEVTLEARGDAMVVGDRSQLEQAVLNLVINARDAVVATGRAGRIVLTTRDREVVAGEVSPVAAGPWLVLEVIDDGPGIPPELRARVFEPYFTTKTAGPTSGTGLGLATAFGVVGNHGGTIEVDDAPGGRGTVMRIWLPAAGDDAAGR